VSKPAFFVRKLFLDESIHLRIIVAKWAIRRSLYYWPCCRMAKEWKCEFSFSRNSSNGAVMLRYGLKKPKFSDVNLFYFLDLTWAKH
jgi:hypothetical protein